MQTEARTSYTRSFVRAVTGGLAVPFRAIDALGESLATNTVRRFGWLGSFLSSAVLLFFLYEGGASLLKRVATFFTELDWETFTASSALVGIGLTHAFFRFNGRILRWLDKHHEWANGE